ncbi:DUF2796 domain-containing protein [Methylobacillus arboreus]|uniref:DUF2796 domain-containing protein n=1 Tax=Methylobacillus arboreus TaxID=755170 RepID=UPI001E48698B|nr:DUF2796 domain-containing protein [Methylobacillus arboreus]MCB5190778.1 DUF2796 domain-containing protein [Methylobacillus arboreus]
MNVLFKLTVYAVGAGMILAQAQAFAHQPHAHVHGVAKLNIAVDGKTLTLALESPLQSFLGFEHAPRNEQEKTAVVLLKKQLSAPAQLFALPSKAECRSTGTTLDSPVFNDQPASDDSEHADVDAEFLYECRQPGQLTEVTIQLFKLFPNLHEINVQIVTDRGQKAAKLTVKQNRVAW